jgi:glucose/arabinose dehydrogenase
MKGLHAILCVLFGLVMAGCTFGSPTVSPTDTATPGIFIRVSTPTVGATSPHRPTPSPTPTASEIVTGTLVVQTLTPTPTPTPIPANVAQLPDPAGYSWQEVVAGLSMPVGLMNAADGSGRIFIIEQDGLIRILKDGSLLTTPFLDLTQKVDCCGEKGLLGLAFHPDYIQNGYFYVDYVELLNGQLFTVVARYQVSADNPDQADPGSEERILHIEQPFQNHKGGQLQFGPDGYLYIGMGDGGSEGDPLGNGQSLQTLLGKLLRIDIDHSQPYTIPSDNPFASGGGFPEIWAYGLRNPWRFSFDRLNGDLYIGDVGQDAWEEIDWLSGGSPGGSNFGWSYYEGSHPYRGSPPANETFVMPVAEYSHAVGNAVISGYVYRGQSLPAWQGVYFYGDYASGRVWGLLHMPDGTWQNAQMFETGLTISSFGVDENGEIYLADYAGRVLNLK